MPAKSRKSRPPSPLDEEVATLARRWRRIREAIGEHIRNGNKVANPDSLVDRVYEFLFGEE